MGEWFGFDGMKRRAIKKWTSVHTATREFECAWCDALITPTEEYRRMVFALPNRIEVDRQHNSPDCEQKR